MPEHASTWSELGIVLRQGTRVEQRVACPRCAKGGRDDALGVNTDSGAFHCFRCGWRGRLAPSDPHRPLGGSMTRIDDPAVAERKRARVRETWRQTVALDDRRAHAVRRYLAARGLDEILRRPPRSLRAHPSLEYWDGSHLVDRFPAMVALFHSATAEPLTVHVTYVSAAGSTKAPVGHPKKILGAPQRGSTRGGAIRLFDPRGGTLGVCEGVENALSLHLIQRIPTWAAYCAGNLEHVRLPSELRRLEIGVDIDASGRGEQAARALATRVLRARPRTEVIYVRPEVEGFGDLNDELRRKVR